MKRLLTIFAILFSFLLSASAFAQRSTQSITRIRGDSTNLNHVVDVTLFGNTFDATTQYGIHSLSGIYFYDGTNFRRWLGAQMNSETVAATTYSPMVHNFNFAYDPDNDLWRWLHITNSFADSMVITHNGLVTGSVTYGYDATGADLDMIRSATHADGLATTNNGLFTISPLYGYDPVGADFNMIRAIEHADDIPVSYTGIMSAAVMYGYDGAALDMARIGAAGELQVTDVATRAGEDAGNDWRKVKKEETAVYNPAATTGTAVDSTTDTILASVEVLSYPNFCVWVKNAGGGSADAFTGVDIDASPDGTEWVDINWSACDTLASGDTCVYCVSGNAYRYVRVQAVCGAGDDTTADAWITANKN